MFADSSKLAADPAPRGVASTPRATLDPRHGGARSTLHYTICLPARQAKSRKKPGKMGMCAARYQHAYPGWWAAISGRHDAGRIPRPDGAGGRRRRGGGQRPGAAAAGRGSGTPEQRRDKGGFGGKKPFTPSPRAGGPGTVQDAAGAQRPPHFRGGGRRDRGRRRRGPVRSSARVSVPRLRPDHHRPAWSGRSLAMKVARPEPAVASSMRELSAAVEAAV